MQELKQDPSREIRPANDRSSQILNAAASLFAENGFHRTTTRQIAKAAHIAEGTLYNYFANKDEILYQIMQKVVDLVRSEASQTVAKAEDARQYLLALFALRNAIREKHLVLFRALFSEILANSTLREMYYQQIIKPAIQEMDERLQHYAQRGQIHISTIPETTRIITGLFIGLFMLEMLGDPFASDPAASGNTVGLTCILDGLIIQESANPL